MKARNSAMGISIVADVGGTNTRVALTEGAGIAAGSIRRFRNADHPDLETILRTYLAQEGTIACAGACVAVAGPVRDGIAEMTNLDWTMDGAMLRRATGAATVSILNDLQAQGHAIGYLNEGSIRRIIEAPAAGATATRLVIGVGTGFNAAAVFDTAQGRIVTPSESGHANLSIRSQEDMRLGRSIASNHGFPAVEDVLSGRGLERVYDWLGAEAGDPREKSAADIMATLGSGDDRRAEEAVRVFARILGTEAGNLALVLLPFGGIYLVGGVARAFAPYLENHGFVQAFHDKGRFAGFMENFAVSVVEDDYAALIGCARYLAALPPQS